MATSKIDGNLIVTGALSVGGAMPVPTRSQLAQESNSVFDLPLENFRVWDAYATVLPGTAAADDLALVGGTFGTGVPSIETSDSKNTSVTQRARITAKLPPEYVAGQTVTVRLKCGMVTTVASTSATVDVEAYLSDGFGAKTGSDLVLTSAQSINSLTAADQDFVLDGSGLEPGDALDIRITIAIVDSATVTAVKGRIGKADLLCDIKG